MQFKKLNSDYAEFGKEMNKNLNIFYKMVSNSNPLHLNKDQRNTLVELSFLSCYIAWETFLHKTIIDILLYKHKRTKVSRVEPRDKEHVEKLIKLSAPYPRFDYSAIIDRENLFLKVNIYERVISARRDELEIMRKIRNMAAHEGITQKEFYGSVVSHVAPHIILNDAEILRLPGIFLSCKTRNTNKYFFNYYIDVMDSAAKEIIRDFNAL